MEITKKRFATLLIAFSIIASLLTGTIVYVIAQSASNTAYLEEGIYVGAPSYTFWRDGYTYYVKNSFGHIEQVSSNITNIVTTVISGISNQTPTFYFKNGLYDFNNHTITVNYPINIIGENCNSTILQEIQLNYTIGAGIGESPSGTLHPTYISNLKLRYISYTTSVIGIYVRRMWGLTIENCKIENYETGVEIYAPFSNYAYGITLRKVYFINPETGVLLDRYNSSNSPNLNTIEHCKFTVSSSLGHYQSGSSGIKSTYNSKLTIDHCDFYGLEKCLELTSNIAGMSFIHNYVEYGSNIYMISSDGTTRSVQQGYIMGNIVAQDYVTEVYHDIRLTADTMIQSMKPLTPVVNGRTTPLDPMTAAGQWTVAFCNIPSGTVIAAGLNTFYFNNTICDGNRYPVTVSIIYNGGSANQFTLTAEDYSHTAAGLESIRVQLTSSGGFTLGADFVFYMQLYFS